MGISKQGVISFNGSPNSNLLPHTDTMTYGLGYMGTYSSGTREVDNTVLFNGKPTIKIQPSSSTTSSGANNLYNGVVNLTANKTYCYSLWILSDVADTWAHNSLGHYQTWTSSASHNQRDNVAILTNIPANKWTLVAQTFVPTVNCNFRSYHIYFANTSQTIWISDVKLEEGSVPTLWTPNVNDDIYISNPNSFIEINDNFKIQKNGYVQANEFIEI